MSTRLGCVLCFAITAQKAVCRRPIHSGSAQTFGSDMIRAGVSLPVLQRLMGHAHIHTTPLYIQLTQQDVFTEYARAVERIANPENPPL